MGNTQSPASANDRASKAILIVDERSAARDLQRTLTGMGYGHVEIAGSPEEALERASDHRPDLVLMDTRVQRLGNGLAVRLRDGLGAAFIYLKDGAAGAPGEPR